MKSLMSTAITPCPLEFAPETVQHLLTLHPDEAYAYLLQFAKRGHAPAQTLLGQCYLDGHGMISPAATEARYWFTRAAHAGHAMAMNMLGRCHENGWGGPVDEVLAAIWFRRAAEAGLDWGLYNYAHVLARGRGGVTQDHHAALALFQRAAELNHGRSMHFIGLYYEQGGPVAINQQQAFDWYQRAAATGDYRGLSSWGSVLVEQGRLSEALPVLRQALATAPPAYARELRRQLQASTEPPLQALGATPSADA